jgi:predicted RNase H-like HicB family nuclease
MAKRLRQLELTAVYRKVPEGYIQFIEELPGANTQGRTLDEVPANLRKAAQLALEANRILAMANTDPGRIIREPLRIAASMSSRGSGAPSRGASRAP